MLLAVYILKYCITYLGTRLLRSRNENATPNLCWVFCALWVSCANNKGGFIEIAFVVVVGTHLHHFEALAYVWPHFDALTLVVIRVSSAFVFQTFAEVCYSVFVNRSSFKSLLNLRKAYIFESLLKAYYRSVFAESFKTFIFQKFREPLCHKVNLQSCVPRRRHFIMTCDIFGTGQTNILGLCYLFGKSYKQPTVAPLKSLKSTHSTKLLQHLLRQTIRYH